MDGRSETGELNREVPSNDVPTSFNMREFLRKLLLSVGIWLFSEPIYTSSFSHEHASFIRYSLVFVVSGQLSYPLGALNATVMPLRPRYSPRDLE